MAMFLSSIFLFARYSHPWLMTVLARAEQERIPFAEGYDPRSKQQTTLMSLGTLVPKIKAASPPGIPTTFTPEQLPCPTAGG